MRLNFKKYILVTLAILFCSCSYAWGVIGHRVVGKIAQNHLNENALSKINEITNGLSLADISVWADEIKSDPDTKYKKFRTWHYIDANLNKGDAKTNIKYSKDNIISAIYRVTDELRLVHGVTSQDKFESLALLVHLVGDIHQPLHVYDEHRGANNCYVNWFSPRFRTSLHKVWDSLLINNLKLSYTEYAESLDHITAKKLLNIQNTDAIDWANESKDLHSKIYPEATDKVRHSYCYTNKKDIKLPVLGYRYIYNNRKIVDERLLYAGVRLAGVLNSIFA